MKKRLFIAVDISEEAREEAARYISDLASRFPLAAAKWERPEKLHLTLKFLGGTEEHLLDQIIELTDHNARLATPFEITIDGTGAFPSARNPRVLWLGVRETSGTLKDLAARIDEDCAQLGFERERRAFKPHLTLARIRDPRSSGGLGTEHAASQFGPVRFTCDELVIYESHLGRGGSIYEKLHAAKFALSD